jgi:hypothetical protein
VEGRGAFGERAGRRDGRVGGDGRWRPQAKDPLCAALDGFSLSRCTPTPGWRRATASACRRCAATPGARR